MATASGAQGGGKKMDLFGGLSLGAPQIEVLHRRCSPQNMGPPGTWVCKSYEAPRWASKKSNSYIVVIMVLRKE